MRVAEVESKGYACGEDVLSLSRLGNGRGGYDAARLGDAYIGMIEKEEKCEASGGGEEGKERAEGKEGGDEDRILEVVHSLLNTSDAEKLLASFARDLEWADHNFVCCHGVLARKVALLAIRKEREEKGREKGEKEDGLYQVEGKRELEKRELEKRELEKRELEAEEERVRSLSKNLFCVRVDAGKRAFHLIRHCTREWQGSLWREHSPWNGDPPCLRSGMGEKGGKGVGTICEAEGAEKMIRRIVRKEGLGGGGGEKMTCNVYASCLRRARETGEVVISALRGSGAELKTDAVQVIPYAREARNWPMYIVAGDPLNECTMEGTRRIVQRTREAKREEMRR